METFTDSNLNVYISAKRYVFRLQSFLDFYFGPMASKLAEAGFYYDKENECLICSSCNFEISVKNGRYVEDHIIIHRVKSHGDEEWGTTEKGADKMKTDSFKSLACNLEILNIKLDARIVKALLDTPQSVFLINSGFHRNLVKLSLIIHLASPKGSKDVKFDEQIDMILNLRDTDLDVLCPEFDKLLFVPPMKMFQTETSPQISNMNSVTNDSLVSLEHKESRFSKSLLLNVIRNNFDWSRKEKSRKQKKKKLTNAKEPLAKMDYNASGLLLMLVGTSY